MVVTLLGGSGAATFTIHYYARETYERALAKAGFREVRWHNMLLPPELQPAAASSGRPAWSASRSS